MSNQENLPAHNTFVLGNKTYDFFKKLVQIILPAASALYFGLASIWDFPSPDKVVGTIAVITTFLGVCLGISTAQYNASGLAYDGDIVVQEHENGKKTMTLELGKDPNVLDKQKSINFKVRTETPPAQIIPPSD